MAVADRLRADGYHVATIDLNPSDDEFAHTADVTDRAQVDAALAAIRAQLGPVTVLVNRRTFRRPTLATRAVRLRLGMVFGRALAGRRLTVDVAASNDAGERQAFARGGTIRVLRR